MYIFSGFVKNKFLKNGQKRLYQNSYFKITNATETHNGFCYKDGLNILDKEFEEQGSCVPGGLYFTTIDHIKDFYDYGINLRKINLPLEYPWFRMVPDPSGNKYRANALFFEEKYSLLDPHTYQKFNLEIEHNKFIVDIASEYGNINFLNWWKKEIDNFIPEKSHNNSRVYTPYFLDKASKLKYTHKSIDDASAGGHINVLDWWLRSGFKMKYTSRAIDMASRNGHINVLNWWLRSGLPLHYSERALDTAYENNNRDVLNWWNNSDLMLKSTKPSTKE